MANGAVLLGGLQDFASSSTLHSSYTQKSLGSLGLFKQERVDKGIETDGSNLSGVSAKCAWDDLSRPPEDDEDSRSICIGTQPRRLSGKGRRDFTESLSASPRP